MVEVRGFHFFSGFVHFSCFGWLNSNVAVYQGYQGFLVFLVTERSVHFFLKGLSMVSPDFDDTAGNYHVFRPVQCYNCSHHVGPVFF